MRSIVDLLTIFRKPEVILSMSSFSTVSILLQDFKHGLQIGTWRDGICTILDIPVFYEVLRKVNK